MQLAFEEAGAFSPISKASQPLALLCLALCLMLVGTIAFASTTGGAFQIAYDFIYEAATGYLGRTICITGGVIGLGVAAGTGKAVPAAIGIVLAIFGILGPDIVDTIFNSAVI